MAHIDELRLMAKVARMYYEQGIRQSDIAHRLYLSQAKVSRLLKNAEKEQIVRISVSVPHSVYSELEEALVDTYGLQDAVVADTIQDDDEEAIRRDIGGAAAHYLATTLNRGECIGISSWSGTLLAMVNVMHQIPHPIGAKVVQILGGASESKAKIHAAYLATALAERVRGEAVFLPAPGIVSTEDARQILLDEPSIREVTGLFNQVTLALVGIGAVEPSPLLASSGNIFSPEELDMLRNHGAVGDILNFFFDAAGNPTQKHLANRVIGMSLDQLRKVERSVGVAGGKRKLAAIRGALEGGWINVLITDCFTAERLLSQQLPSEQKVPSTENHARSE